MTQSTLNQRIGIIMAVSAMTLAACASYQSPSAQSTLFAKSGSSVTGDVRFTQTAQGVLVQATISGLKPNSEHGFHIHEKGDCSAVDATSAGGHYNPSGASHGHAGHANTHHAGDMPNLKTDGNGMAKYEATLTQLAIGSGNDIRGRSVVVHKDPDDYKSQPAGNSGVRIACGVIQ